MNACTHRSWPWLKITESTLEVLTIRKSGREVHQHRPDEVTAQIVSDSLRPGAMVNKVAVRHGLKPNHLSTWRTMARQGKLVLPAPEDTMEFAAVIIDPLVSEPPIKKSVAPRSSDHRRFCHFPSRRRRVCRPGSSLSRVPERFRHDLSVEPCADHGGRPSQSSFATMRRRQLCGAGIADLWIMSSGGRCHVTGVPLPHCARRRDL
ncbi:transposase [Rhizobium mongolense]|uniref:transposase n=1 Tax=Rhizobium mongolense TaxID=57676 RepID=UPI0034A5D1ED